jgi:YhcH/YjgK/YiaL family protein
MLICNIDQLASQVKLNEKMQKAIDFLKKTDLNNLPNGRTEIDGEAVYAKVFEYETISWDEVKYEAHEKYIDLQYVISGKEAMGYIDVRKLKKTDEYNPQKDVVHGTPFPAKDVSWTVLTENELAVCYPIDAHAPKGVVETPEKIKKIIIKIAI